MPPTLHAEGIFISAPDRADIAYDDTRQVLYISSGEDLLRYDVLNNAFLAPIAGLGKELSGLDISPDGSRLAVGDQRKAGALYLVQLDTLAVTTADIGSIAGEAGPFAVAFGSDSNVIVSSAYFGSADLPLRRYEPASGAVTVIANISDGSMIRASADGSVIGVAETYSNGGVGRYRVGNGNYLAGAGTGFHNHEIAVSRDGQQFAILRGSDAYIADAGLVQTGLIAGSGAGRPIGVAYHPAKDLLYLPWSSGALVKVYDTASLSVVRSYDFETSFEGGFHAYDDARAKTSKDGALLFVTVRGGVRYVTTNVSAPANISATGGNQQVTLSWDAAAGATGYRIYQGLATNAVPLTAVASNVQGTSITLGGLTNGVTYYFKLSTEAAAGISTPSTAISSTPYSPIGVPGNLQAIARDTAVDLSWDAVAGAAGYVIYQGTTSGGAVEVVRGIAANSYHAGGLANGTTYYFQVAALDADGAGPRSNEVTKQPSPPPFAPTLWAYGADGQVTLYWYGVGETYNIYAGTSSGGESPTPLYTNVIGTSKVIGSLTNDTTYFFRIEGVNSSGVGEQSNEAHATPKALPAAPSNLVATAGPGSITLNWTAPAGAETYKVYVGENADGSDRDCILEGFTNTSATLTLQAGKAYYFVVAAVNSTGEGLVSNEVSAQPAQSADVQIQLSQTDISSGQASLLSWSSTNVSSCAASGDWEGSYPVSGSIFVAPTAARSYVYTMTCTGFGGSESASVTLNVTEAPPGENVTGSLDWRPLLLFCVIAALRLRPRRRQGAAA